MHITGKHTMNAIQKSRLVKLGVDGRPRRQSEVTSQLANAAYDRIVEKGFDRGDEDKADKKRIRLANKVGYSAIRAA